MIIQKKLKITRFYGFFKQENSVECFEHRKSWGHSALHFSPLCIASLVCCSDRWPDKQHVCIHFRIRIDGKKRQIVPAIFSLKYFITGFPFIHFLLNNNAAVLAGFGCKWNDGFGALFRPQTWQDWTCWYHGGENWREDANLERRKKYVRSHSPPYVLQLYSLWPDWSAFSMWRSKLLNSSTL